MHNKGKNLNKKIWFFWTNDKQINYACHVISSSIMILFGLKIKGQAITWKVASFEKWQFVNKN
jgi:hypothetical protein